MVCPAGKTEKLELIRIPRSAVTIVAGDRAGGTGISNPVSSSEESVNFRSQRIVTIFGAVALAARGGRVVIVPL